jgi:hypothetical protein
MGKLQVNHRIVTRDASGAIVSDVHHDSFAVAEPAYRLAAASVPEGFEVSLQHGARVIFKAGSKEHKPLKTNNR